MVHGEVDIPIRVGSQVFDSMFYVMDIRPSYSCLLGRPWIHEAGAVTSTLHQMLKYPVKGRLSRYGEKMGVTGGSGTDCLTLVREMSRK